jgi:hypothetical protein
MKFYTYYRILCTSGYHATAITITTITLYGVIEDHQTLFRGRERTSFAAAASTAGQISTSGATITAETEFSSSYLASYAFDSNLSTRWASTVSSLPSWIKVDLGAGNAQIVMALSYCPETAAPKNFTFSGSNNDADWTQLLSAVGTNAGIGSEYQTWLFSNETAYRYYQMDISSAFDTLVSIYEIKLLNFRDAILRLPNPPRRSRFCMLPVSRGYAG